MTTARPPGPRTGWRAQNADRVIRMTEQLVSAQGMTQADLTPAREALQTAKARYRVHDYSEAVAQAKRAEVLAASLNERFDAFMAAWTALGQCMEELREIGLPTEDLEAALDAADKEVVRAVSEDGIVVPNYRGATAIVEEAARRARVLAQEARAASHEVFLAMLAVESLGSPTDASSALVLHLDRRIEQASRELALGNVSLARRIATEARSRADGARVSSAQAEESLQQSEAILAGLRECGLASDPIGPRVRSVREALVAGRLDPEVAQVVARHLFEEVRERVARYTRACRVVERADHVYARLQQEGFCSYEVDGDLGEARVALQEGDWAGVREGVGRALRSFLDRRKDRDALAKSIAEIHEGIALMGDAPIPVLPDIQEMLGRAMRELRSGQFSGASEDVLFARALVAQALRAGP